MVAYCSATEETRYHVIFLKVLNCVKLNHICFLLQINNFFLLIYVQIYKIFINTDALINSDSPD